MHTVKQWRDLGVDFVIGDKLSCNTIPIEEQWYIEKAINDGLADYSCVDDFVPRENTGSQAVKDGVMVEVEFNGYWYKGHNAYDAGSLNWGNKLFSKWIPSKIQPLLSDRNKTIDEMVEIESIGCRMPQALAVSKLDKGLNQIKIGHISNHIAAVGNMVKEVALCALTALCLYAFFGGYIVAMFSGKLPLMQDNEPEKMCAVFQDGTTYGRDSILSIDAYHEKTGQSFDYEACE